MNVQKMLMNMTPARDRSRSVTGNIFNKQTTDILQVSTASHTWDVGNGLRVVTGAVMATDRAKPVSYPGRSSYIIGVSATNSPDSDGPEIDVTADLQWWV